MRVGEFVRVLHFLDRFRAPFLGEVEETPIVEQPVVNPVLVDRGELRAKTLVEIFDDFGIALHGGYSLENKIFSN